MQNLDQKVNVLKNTVCSEQRIYTSQKNFTPTLLVMLETFRRSAVKLKDISNNTITSLKNKGPVVLKKVEEKKTNIY